MANVLIRLRTCAVWSGHSLTAYAMSHHSSEHGRKDISPLICQTYNFSTRSHLFRKLGSITYVLLFQIFMSPVCGICSLYYLIHYKKCLVKRTAANSTRVCISFSFSFLFFFFFFFFFFFVLFALLKHAFSNILNISSQNGKFSNKISDIFHISAQNIDCGYSLEPSCQGGSNEYPQCMFLSRNNNVHPPVYYIKVGF